MAFQRRSEFRGVLRDVDAVEIARSRQINFKDLADPARRGRHDHDAIGQARGFADVVGDEDDRLAPFLPDLLDIAVELLARHGVERGERFVHQQDPRVRRQGAGQGDALFHSTGELMHICLHELFQTHQVEKEFRDFASFGIAQPGLQFQTKHDVAEKR